MMDKKCARRIIDLIWEIGVSTRKSQIEVDDMAKDKATVFNYLGYSGAKVFLVGDFSAWKKIQMEETVVDDTESVSNYHYTMTLPDGRYQYKFIVDGEYIVDPSNPNSETTQNGLTNSVLLVEKNQELNNQAEVRL